MSASASMPDGALPQQRRSADEAHPDAGTDSARALRIRQISHDMHHQLGTIMLLASLLATAQDVGPTSQERARQILGEAQWLHQLQKAYGDSILHDGKPAHPVMAPISLGAFVGEVVAAIRLSSLTDITLVADEVWALIDKLAFWRAMRNLLGNAVRAAGPDGAVEVRVERLDGWAVVGVGDSGPGFGAVPGGLASLGLGVVQECVTACGGELEIDRNSSDGCRVRLLLPASAPVRAYPALGNA